MKTLEDNILALNVEAVEQRAGPWGEEFKAKGERQDLGKYGKFLEKDHHLHDHLSSVTSIYHSSFNHKIDNLELYCPIQ